MNSSKKILELISSFVEKGILTTEDIRKECLTYDRTQGYRKGLLIK